MSNPYVVFVHLNLLTKKGLFSLLHLSNFPFYLISLVFVLNFLYLSLTDC